MAPVTLANATLRLTADPAAGGKITELFVTRLGRNLLAEARPGATLALEGAVFSVSGWDEAIPSLEPCAGVPTLGHAWRRPAACAARGGVLRTRWTLPGWRMARAVTLADDGLRADYAITNTGTSAPLLWAAHALFSVDGLARAELPAGAMRPGPGCDVAELAARLAEGGRAITDFHDVGQSWKFFLPAEGAVVLHYGAVRVILETEAPWWGLWLNRGRVSTRCLGIEPTNAATDDGALVPTLPAGGRYCASWRLKVAYDR